MSLIDATAAASRVARRQLPGARSYLLVERNYRAFRHVWSTIVSGFFEPVLYLFSIGVGLGGLVGEIAVGDRSVPYPVFVAPALMAASAMNGAIYDSAHNIFWKLRYARLYDTVLASPLGVADIAVGEVSWALLRGVIYATGFLGVAAAAGMVGSWWAVLAVPAAVLIGLAFAGVGMACATLMRSWQDFDLLQLAMLPLFLFSATFYPLSTYSPAWQPVVAASPLYQSTELMRGLMLGEVGLDLLGHAGYLVVMGLLGMALAARRLRGMLLR